MGLKEMLATYQAKAYRALQDEGLVSRRKHRQKHKRSNSTDTSSNSSNNNSSNDYIDTTFPQLNSYQIAVNGAPFSRRDIICQDITPQDPIYARINGMVEQNNLHQFYDKKQIANIVKTCHSHNYNHIADLFKFPSVELAVDLCALALYDIIILADDSGSMKATRDEDRVSQLKRICKDIAEISTLFDDDGISIRFLNSNLEGDNLRSEDKVTKLINKVNFDGMTPLGGALTDKVLKPFLYDKRSLSKPLLIIIVTDGRPTENREVFENAISYACEKYNKKSKIVGFEIAQIGNDSNAQQWLDYLDNHKHIGKFIDVTSDFETEQMQYTTPFNYYLWLLKLMLGGIDKKYDTQDEN